jgi:BirA family biotin operon repressor/biotin-[acetyl-CoA-carboxylase] ligase
VIPERLIALLADGRFHSGAALAAELGITRAAVWKQVGHLAGLGLDVQRVKGRGYRLAHPIELLDPARIRAALTESVRGRLGELRFAATLPSTNTALLARDGDGLDVCLAEHQSDGRGRQGRTWVSPYGAGICLSVGWTFIALPRGIQSLSLAIGVGVAERLARLGLPELELKWPNDLLVGGRKLGGILVELRGESMGRTRAVIGVGLNFGLPAGATIDQPWIDLRGITGDAPPGRNIVAAALIDGVVGALDEFSSDGFAGFVPRWSARDALRDAEVEYLGADGAVRRGRATGIFPDGALRVEQPGAVERVMAGDVRVRRA